MTHDQTDLLIFNGHVHLLFSLELSIINFGDIKMKIRILQVDLALDIYRENANHCSRVKVNI